VPIYDVEAYLAKCLRSLAAQTARDLEVVMVDDGSSDGSAAIAESFAERDPRFRLIAQENHGLGHARNTGVAAATGELLAFADSDDIVPCDAYELLAGALDQTGSDFASGNVLRLEDGRTTQAPFLSQTFARTRLKTHVTRFRPLLADRTAWNKLFRRDFWDGSALRFPEGVLHEDIPVMLPAHVRAGSVDVLVEPVYYWRIRGDGASITQKRQEMRALLDRLAAIEHVRADLAVHAPRKVQRWYDERLLRDDLRLHLNVLADADPAYRASFMAHAAPILDGLRRGVVDALPAIDRLKWQLVWQGRTEELIEVLRFDQERRAATPPLRRWGRWYGDYPFRGDRELGVPRSVYRLGKPDQELSLRATVEELSCEDDRLVVRGHAHVAGLAVASPGDQRVRVLAVRAGRFQRLRMRTTAVRAPARPVERPELAADGLDRRWSGFEAALPTSALRGTGTWQLCLYVRAHGLRRRFQRFALDDVVAAELPAASGLTARAVACPTGRVELQIRDRWARTHGARLVHGDVLELTGELRLAGADRLEARRADGWTTEVALAAGDGSFSARLPLSQLYVAPRGETDGDARWELAALDGGRRVPLALPGPSPALRWWSSGRALALARTPEGGSAIVERDARPLVAGARWRDGSLELDVRLPPGLAERELVLLDWHRRREHAFALTDADADGALRAVVPVADLLLIPAGLTPRRGEWRFYGRPLGSPQRTALARVRLPGELAETLPLAATVDERPFTLAPAPDGSLMLSVPERSAVRARGRAARRRAPSAASAAEPAG
jgi:CDP-glycerol glycerophosphotransferase